MLYIYLLFFDSFFYSKVYFSLFFGLFIDNAFESLKLLLCFNVSILKL